jgi:uncharacterized membrane protein
MKTLKQFFESVIRYEMAPKKKALAKRSSSSAGGDGDGGDGGGGDGGE